jgi:putative GTP pyrophosphokinase
MTGAPVSGAGQPDPAGVAVARDAEPPFDLEALEDLRQLRDQFTRFMLEYKFGIEEVRTKIAILEEELTHLHDDNPIEHVLSRVKTPESILEKVRRRGTGGSFEEIRESVTDIAGVRVTCSFVSDVYRVFDMLTRQPDLTVRQVKDYIAHPKPNGYRSLHALVEVPVYLSDRMARVTVEVQLRTVAMDFWASLEHKIYYKFHNLVPDAMQSELREAADTAAVLDRRLEKLHQQVHGPGTPPPTGEDEGVLPDDDDVAQLAALRTGLDPRRRRAGGPAGPTVVSGPVTGRGRPAPEDRSQKESS